MAMASSFQLKEFKERILSTGYAGSGMRLELLPAALDIFDSGEC